MQEYRRFIETVFRSAGESLAEVSFWNVDEYEKEGKKSVSYRLIFQSFDRTLTVSGLETGASWSYSLNGGATWASGSGTSLVVSVPNRPGAVHDMLVPLKLHGVSMTRFESRPARSGQWEYFFYIDLQGHPSEPNVAAALQDLRGICAFYKVLGTYPLAD